MHQYLTDDCHDSLSVGRLEEWGLAGNLAAEQSGRIQIHRPQDDLCLRRLIGLKGANS